MTSDIEVLVLGAGPGGLSLSRELARRNVSYLLLEKEPTVGATFANMTESTTYGPWINNTLPGSPVPWYRWLTRTTRSDYARYLRDYARQHQLRVLTGTQVQAVRREGDAFFVETCAGEFSARYLVNATGYFSKPNVPEYPGSSTCAIPSLHSSAYRAPETVQALTGRSDAKVLIVGSRLSAGEIMEELDRAGYRVELSHREPIDTWPSPWEEAFLSPFTFLWEEIALRLGLGRPGNLRPRLRRGRQWQLLQSGKVKRRPAIAFLDRDQVIFSDHSQGSYDAILYATGYRAALDHLAPMVTTLPEVRDLESVEIPNCFFLGLVGGRSFRSEFLRGLREDARYLAALLERRVHLSRPRDLGHPSPPETSLLTR